jgi:FRG domain-containing protein
MARRMALAPQGAITSVPAFLERLLELRERHNNRKLWYRGHDDPTYKLVPTIGRKQKYAGRELILPPRMEWELLHRFRRRIYLEIGRLLPAGEALFVARHHGLPTRLLDWTANALYGLYFACCGDPKGGGTLWAIKRFDDPEELDSLDVARCEGEKKLIAKLSGQGIRKRWPSTPKRLKLVEPLFNSPRLRAQDGAFTVTNAPTKPLDEFATRECDRKELDIEILFKWSIAPGGKPRILRELSGLGVTHRIVFPDLDGIAKSLWETEVLWSWKA